MMSRRSLAVVAAVLLFAPLGRAAELDPYLPEDSESVLNLNVRQILDSELVKKNLLEMAQEALRGNDQVQDILKELNFDPFKDLDRIVVASPVSTEKDRGLIIVRGRFDVAKFQTKAEAVAKDHGDHLKIHKVLSGKHTLYEVNIPDRDEVFFVALASRDTLLVSPGKDYVVEALKKIGKTDKPTLKNKKFQALVEKVDARQSLSLALVKSPEIQKALGNLPGDIKAMIAKVQALAGGVTITDEVRMQLVIGAKNPRDAKELGASLTASLKLVLGLAAAFTQNESSPEAELILEIIKSLSVKQKGDTVAIKGRISNDLIEETIKKKSQ